MATSIGSVVLKYLDNFSLAALEPLLASEYISSETSTPDRSVLLPSLYSRAGSGLTRISNLFPSNVKRTVEILLSTIWLVKEFFLKYIYLHVSCGFAILPYVLLVLVWGGVGEGPKSWQISNKGRICSSRSICP